MLALLVSNGEGQRVGGRPFNKADSQVCEKLVLYSI
jgi:hypothetical protein